MKNDLFTSIVVAVLGIVASFIICNFFTGEIEPASVKTVDDSFSIDIAEPNIEVFNYRAINPTVEVYIGDGSEQIQPESSSDQGND